MAQAESKLSREIMSALRARGIWCMKIHGGPTMMAGAPDIVACVPVCFAEASYEGGSLERHLGLFIGFETKTPTGGDPSPIQQRVHGNIRDAWGQVFVVRSVQDAVRVLERLGSTDPTDHPD